MGGYRATMNHPRIMRSSLIVFVGLLPCLVVAQDHVTAQSYGPNQSVTDTARQHETGISERQSSDRTPIVVIPEPVIEWQVRPSGTTTRSGQTPELKSNPRDWWVIVNAID